MTLVGRRRYKQAERPPVLPRTTYTTLCYPFQTIFAEHTYTVQEGKMISLFYRISSWINEVKGKRVRTYNTIYLQTKYLTLLNRSKIRIQIQIRIIPQTQHSALLDRVKGRQQEVQILEEQLRWIYSIYFT